MASSPGRGSEGTAGSSYTWVRRSGAALHGAGAQEQTTPGALWQRSKKEQSWGLAASGQAGDAGHGDIVTDVSCSPALEQNRCV